jgi:hypothetical protein
MDENNKKNLTDIFKKVVSTGINAAFLTEDAIKEAISDLPLPKDIVNGLLQNAKTTKTEFISSIKNELKSYLNKIDISREIDKVLDRYDLEVNAKISFKKKPQKDESI